MKWTENWNRNITKEDTQMSNKHTKWWLTLLGSTEMEMRTRHHHTAPRTVQWREICKNTDNINCCQGSRALTLSHAAGGTVTWSGHCEKHFGNFLWRQIHDYHALHQFTPRCLSKRNETTGHTKLPWMFTEAVSAKEPVSQCPSPGEEIHKSDPSLPWKPPGQ